MVQSVSFSSYLESRASPETSSYTSVPLDVNYLDYTLFVYPSLDTRAAYTNNNPMIAFAVVACTFLFSGLVFVCYDCIVARRQRIVMNRAIASGASKLWPTSSLIMRSIFFVLMMLYHHTNCSCVVSVSCPSARQNLRRA